jgi:hypothetical protein
MIKFTIPQLPGMPYAIQVRIVYSGWGAVAQRWLAALLPPL